jgi:citrate lyase subunit beta/citryl-CoA lyase
MTAFKPLSVPLFVPGHRPELLSKAGSSGADAVILDLEDAVADADKPAAHAALMSRAGLSKIWQLWPRTRRR